MLHCASRFVVASVLVGSAAVAAAWDSSITVVPSPASVHDTLQIAIHDVCSKGPVDILQTTYQVLPGVIRIDATLECGPFDYPSPYDFSITVPPVPAGIYQVEYWENHNSNPATLSQTTTLLVLQSIPVPALTPGTVVLLVLLISLAAVWLLRR